MQTVCKPGQKHFLLYLLHHIPDSLKGKAVHSGALVLDLKNVPDSRMGLFLGKESGGYVKCYRCLRLTSAMRIDEK